MCFIDRSLQPLVNHPRGCVPGDMPSQRSYQGPRFLKMRYLGVRVVPHQPVAHRRTKRKHRPPWLVSPAVLDRAGDFPGTALSRWRAKERLTRERVGKLIRAPIHPILHRHLTGSKELCLSEGPRLAAPGCSMTKYPPTFAMDAANWRVRCQSALPRAISGLDSSPSGIPAGRSGPP